MKQEASLDIRDSYDCVVTIGRCIADLGYAFNLTHDLMPQKLRRPEFPAAEGDYLPKASSVCEVFNLTLQITSRSATLTTLTIMASFLVVHQR